MPLRAPVDLTQRWRRLRLAVVAALVAGLIPATAVGATEDRPPQGRVEAPGLTLLVAAQEDPDGGVVDATSTGGAFTAPANTDFVLDFAGSVDSQTRKVVTTAAGIWSEALETTVPITVDVTMVSMSPGMLGAAGPTSAYFGKPSFPAPDVLYPVALANQFAGRDLDPGAPDIEMVLSSTTTWDRSIDGTVASGAQSMLSVVVHELGHGLGHTSWVRESAGGWVVNYVMDGTTIALAYDRLVATSTGTAITSLPASSLANALTSPLQWWGTQGRAANGGVRPKLYSPSPFELGSSVGHLDEATFTSEVMTPFLGRSEVHTAVPPITRAMLADIGWRLRASTSTPTTTTTAPTPSTTTPTGPSAPLTAAGAADAFIESVATDFLGRSATSTERTTWRNHLLAGGSRNDVTRAYAYSDEWIGVLVDGLYRSTLDRSPDADGRAHWIQVLRSGQTPAQVASYFYASDEYFRRAGGTATAWISDLYAEILGRSADADGLAFWEATARSVPRTAIAFDFYQSLESRRDRVDALFRHLLGRGPDVGGWSYWAGILSSGRDLDLATFLAASDEYFTRSGQRFA